jgi:hypothetical protein
MANATFRRARVALAGILLTVAAPAWAQGLGAGGPGTPAPWFVYGIIIVVLVAALVSLLMIRAAVGQSSWSLADALSEETEVTARIKVEGEWQDRLDAEGKPITVIQMRASVSRLIALMGMIAILLTFLGFGAFALFHFGMTGDMPRGTDDVVSFLAAGMTLFAPYVVNKFSALFDGLAPKSR